MIWHIKVIPFLSEKSLYSQYLLGMSLRSTKKSESDTSYVWEYGLLESTVYHLLVLQEMCRRNYEIDLDWLCPNFRGSGIGRDFENIGKISVTRTFLEVQAGLRLLYNEHSFRYFYKCMEALSQGVEYPPDI